MLRQIIIVGLAISIASCVKLNPVYYQASGALLNNHSLFEEQINIVYAVGERFGDWASVHIVPEGRDWGYLAVRKMTVDSAQAQLAQLDLPITQCYEPVDGVNILRCDVGQNTEGVRDFTIRQTFADEPNAAHINIMVKRDQIILRINTQEDKPEGNLVGEFAPVVP